MIKSLLTGNAKRNLKALKIRKVRQIKRSFNRLKSWFDPNDQAPGDNFPSELIISCKKH